MPLESKPVPALPDSVFSMFSLKGKVAVITGAGGGIGLAVADAYAEAGAEVYITYLSNPAAVKEAAKLSAKWNTKVTAYKLNVSVPKEIEEFVTSIMAQSGRIDIWVANAGVGQETVDIIDGDVDAMNACVDINFRSVISQSRAVGGIFRNQGKGNFIITASAAGWVMARPVSQPVYNATKAAVRHYGASLAYEWRDFARVNSVSPGYILTSLGALPEELDLIYETAFLGRQGDVRELKGVYLYLASDASTYTTGADFVIDGGLSMA